MNGQQNKLPIKILLVDSSPHMLQLVSGLLFAYRIRDVVQVQSSGAAFEELRTTRPDILITELALRRRHGRSCRPDSGLELIRRVRADDRATSRYLPVIVLTSFSEAKWVEAARDAGANEFLAKPISAMSLFSRLNSVIYNQRDFVAIGEFFGPDRRRHRNNRTGLARRTQDDGSAFDEARETADIITNPWRSKNDDYRKAVTDPRMQNVGNVFPMALGQLPCR